MDLDGGAWPISATATALLLTPRARNRDLVRIAVKELVLSGAWRLDRPHLAARDGARARVDLANRGELAVSSSGHRLLLRPGDRPVPPAAPLPRLDAGLRLVAESGGSDVRLTVWRMLQVDVRVLEEVRAAVERELVDRGLAAVRRRFGGLGGTRLVATADGEALLAGAAERQADLRRALDDGGDVAPAVVALGGLVVLADADLVAALAAAVDPRGIEEMVGEVWAAEFATWPQLFAEAERAADAVDGGGGGGGDGGDGAGGGDSGGGGTGG